MAGDAILLPDMWRPLFLALTLAAAAFAQPAGFNYDEAKVPRYELPDVLTMRDGTPVKTPADWTEKRRPEILDLFTNVVYGRSPGAFDGQHYEVLEESGQALGGKAQRKQVRVYFTEDEERHFMDVLIYLPADASGPVPTFVGLSFYGNHTVTDEPEIFLNKNWMRASDDKGIDDHRATEASRGTAASRWPVEEILARGYGVASIYCGDLDPDYHDGFVNGVHPLGLAKGQYTPKPDEWGTISAWAWGLSRALDYFETDDDIDHQRVAVLGHSRLGKTSLWAGAQDERFAMVISNDSGCGGAALSRRAFGETVERINTSFPHWFARRFHDFNAAEDLLPVDQHMLLALVAPRPLYVASATEDQWADPRGEYLSAYHAGAAYRLLGKDALTNETSPAPEKPVMTTVGYHLRIGRHDINSYDWARYMDFADRHWR